MQDMKEKSARLSSKGFILHQSQRLLVYGTQKAYETEERVFIRSFFRVHVSKVPASGSMIGSRGEYKIEECDEEEKVHCP